jgi:hypothetical protein
VLIFVGARVLYHGQAQEIEGLFAVRCIRGCASVRVVELFEHTVPLTYIHRLYGVSESSATSHPASFRNRLVKLLPLGLVLVRLSFISSLQLSRCKEDIV